MYIVKASLQSKILWHH